MTDTTETNASQNVLADAREAAPPAEQAQPAQTQADRAAVQPAESQDAPVEYGEFAMPEGVEVDDDTMSEARALLGEMKLPQEQAQRLVDFYAGKIRQFGEAQTGNWVKLNEKWVGDFKADKEIGGERIQETVAAATRAMERFGTPGLREALAMTGAGNHPEVIRFVARVGRATAEDRFLVASGASSGMSRSAAEVLYPEHNSDD